MSEECPTCGGDGEIAYGAFALRPVVECDLCGGTGEVERA